jgi:hypothetical protein
VQYRDKKMGFRVTIAGALIKFPALGLHWYIRSSSRSAFAQAAAISFLIFAKRNQSGKRRDGVFF